jgi:hypothetical protein
MACRCALPLAGTDSASNPTSRSCLARPSAITSHKKRGAPTSSLEESIQGTWTGKPGAGRTGRQGRWVWAWQAGAFGAGVAAAAGCLGVCRGAM